MRKIVLAAIFATVSGITGASLAPTVFAQGRNCTYVDPVTGTCRSWGSTDSVLGGAGPVHMPIPSVARAGLGALQTAC
jgi:hypothetical protein